MAEEAESEKPRTPMTLITGALGSGKTTLVRRILETTDRRLAVLMNEFGEIAIDSRIIAGENVRIVELAGGCVCCELTGEFEAAVEEIIGNIGPELIVVEATGVADADSLVYEVESNLPRVRLDSVIHIVDAYADSAYPQLGYASRRQLQEADAVLINKVDLAGADEIREIEERVREHNPTAPLFRCRHCAVDVPALFGIEIKPHLRIGPAHGGHDFQSFSFTGGTLRWESLRRLIEEMPPRIYRAKGFVRTDAGELLLNYVAGRIDWEKFETGETKLVFIGKDLDPVKEEILTRLSQSEAR